MGLRRQEGGLELAVVNPSGDPRAGARPDYSPSIMIVQRMMDGAIPGCPQRWFGIVDVRDVADLHVCAMTQHPAARGERFLCRRRLHVDARDREGEARMGAAGGKVPTRQLPNWLVRLAALRDPALQQLSELGKTEERHHAKARGLLGWKPRSSEDAIVASAESLIRLGLLNTLSEGCVMKDFFQRYLLPGFVFESAVIAGGYATGRELVQFFLPAGPWGGVLGMIVSMLFWSAVLMVSFELARMAKAYDYRSFFKLLLGRGWFLFEICYFLLIVIVFAVMGAAAGEITHDLFGLPRLVGSIAMIAATGLMVFYSSAAIEKFLALSVGYLYLVYIVFFIWSFVVRRSHRGGVRRRPAAQGWFKAGITYAGYNVATSPGGVLRIRHLTRRREAMVAGSSAVRSACCRASSSSSRWSATPSQIAKRRPALGVPARQDRRALVRVGVPDGGAADAGRYRRADPARDQRARGEGLRGAAVGRCRAPCARRSPSR